MKTYVKNSLVLTNILILAPLLFLCFYIYPSADDFSYGIALRENTFLDVQKNAYINWTSRYIATAILTLSPIAFSSIKYFGLYSFFLIVFSIYGLYYFFESLELKNKFLLAISFLSIYSLLLTSLCESYYWLAGSITYFLPSIFFLFFLGSIINMQKNSTLKNKLVMLFSVFIIGGCSEIFLGYSFIIIFLMNAYHYIVNRKINYFYFATLLLISSIIIFILICPGNQVRSSAMEKIPLITLLTLSIKKFIVINFRYCIFGFIFILTLLKITKTKLSLIQKVPLWLIVSAYFFFLLIGILVSVYGVKGNFPPRVENLLVFTSFIFLFFISLKVVDQFNFKEKKIVPVGIIFLLIYFILPKNEYQSQNNFTLMYTDIFSGKVFKFKHEMLERDYELKSCDEACSVDEIKSKPMSIFFSDIQKDHNNFINQSIASYYNLERVNLK